MPDLVEGKIEIGSTGEYLDTTIVEQDSGASTHREATFDADPVDNDARRNVVATDGKYGGVIFSHELIRISGLLRDLIAEQKLTNQYLAVLTNNNLGEER